MSQAAQARPVAQPQNNGFPWACEGIAFRSRSHLESIIEQFANEGSKRFLAAAKTLICQSLAAHKLTKDQANDLKKRLHL